MDDFSRIAKLVALGLVLTFAGKAAVAQIIVEDPGSTAQLVSQVQNGLTQLRQLEQQLQAQQQMLQRLQVDVSPDVAGLMQQTQSVVQQMNYIVQQGAALTQSFNSQYPTNFSGQSGQQIQSQLLQTQQNIRSVASQALQVQSQVAANQPAITQQMQQAMAASQAAAGPTAASQASTQMLAVLSQQMADIQASLISLNQLADSKQLQYSSQQAAFQQFIAPPISYPTTKSWSTFYVNQQ